MITNFLKTIKGKELISGAFSSFIFRMSGLIIGYVFVVYAVQRLGVEKYGIFSLSLAVLQTTAIVGRLGVEFSIVKYVAQFSVPDINYGKINEVYWKGFKIIVITGILLTVIIYSLADILAIYAFKNEVLAGSLRIISFGIVPSIIYHFNANALRGLKKPGFYSMVINFLVFTFALALLFFISSNNVPHLLALIYVIATVITAIISFVAWYNYAKVRSNPSTHFLSNKEILTTSLPMLLSGVFIIFNGWVDTLILGILSTEDEVGIFHVLLRIAAIANVFVFAVNSIATPKYAQLSGINQRAILQKHVTKSNKLIAMLNIPVIVGLLVLYKPILNILGSDFPPEKYGLALLFLCLGRFVNSFCGSGGQLLNMTGYQKVNQHISFLIFLLNIALNIVLISKYGIFGAALSNMISNILRNVGYVIFIKIKLGINAIYNPVQDLFYLFQPKNA